MAVTDLTNTKWVLNNVLTADQSIENNFGLDGYINFISNNIESSNFYLFYDGDELQLSYNNVSGYVYYNYNGGWINQAYRIIEITGGTDATNASLISWLTSNATQVVEPKYTLRIDGVEVTDYENVIVNGVSYKCKGKTLISFTIAGTSYQAEDGMTWAEWIASSYNTGGFYLDNSNSVSGNTLGLVSTDGYSSEKGTDVIVADYAYTYYKPGGGGSND